MSYWFIYELIIIWMIFKYILLSEKVRFKRLYNVWFYVGDILEKVNLKG